MTRFALSRPHRLNLLSALTTTGALTYGSSPPPSPSVPVGQYRNQQPYLFNAVSAATIAARVSGGSDFLVDSASYSPGPTRTYVDNAGWPWVNLGGDWIDANLDEQGSVPWASVATPNAANNQTYSVSVTNALRHVRQLGGWNAWIARVLTGAAPRQCYGRFAATEAYRPRIEVTYTDATTATLACRVSAHMGNSVSNPLLTEQYTTIAGPTVGGWALEFDLPTKAVSSATLYFTVYQHWGGSATFEFNLANPPLNADPVRYGVAAEYPLDDGLTAESSIIGQHRYADGSVLSDFVSSVVFDTEDPNSYSPELTGGSADNTKLPTRDLGKFIGGAGFYGNTPQVVDSAYSGDGFEPLADGIGALRVEMPAGVSADGEEGGQGGTGAANTFIFLPAAKFGLTRRLFTRYYQRIGVTTDTGDPYNVTESQMLHVLKLGDPVWTDMAGKCSIGAAHKTRSGGNSGLAGGGHGYSLRREFGDYRGFDPSPSQGGWGQGLSFTDYQGNNEPGHQYGGANLLPKEEREPAQRGGLGAVLYANRWYCIEEDFNLNTLTTVQGNGRTYDENGEYRLYVDGRLVFEKTGLVFRSLPLQNSFPALFGSVRELGHAHLWFNWFHGGLTQNSVDRVVFITGLAWGEEYIGPMAGVQPAWRSA